MTDDENSNAPAATPPPSSEGSGLEETLAARATEPNLPRLPESDGAHDDWVGRSLGKYQVTEVLGRGGMGMVLKARDSMLQRDVAIKVLADHLADDAGAAGRFLAEARAEGQLNHPNVVGIYEACQDGNVCFLVMEYVPGGSLGDRLEKHGALSLLESTQALVDACKGVGAAHAAGLIHRDIKPANLMRAADESVKVSDFGLVKATSSQSAQMTQAGMVIGTPFFMSPEQCQGAPVDARSDIYSLGATYYSLLTGKHPYQDSTSVPQLMYAHCHGEVPDPRAVNDSIPTACSRIVARAMAKTPEERYQTVKGMLADLELVCATLSGRTLTALPSESGTYTAIGAKATVASGADSTSRNSRRVLLGGGAALVVLLAALLMSWLPWQDQTPPPGGAARDAPPTAEPIKIGIVHSLSGTMAGSETVVVDATLFAIHEINQSGGVLGRPLQAVVADAKSDPAIFAQEVERLITRENVCTVFGCWTSASRKTVKPIVEEHDHLLVYPLQYEGLETSPNIVYMGAAPNQQILPAIEWAVTSLAKRRFFLVGSDYVFPRAANEIVKDDLKRLGAEVVGEQYLPLGSSDVGSLVDAIAQAEPEMILNTINGDSNVAFFRALRSAGINSRDCPTLSFSIGEAEVRNLSADDIEGDFAAWTYFQTIDTPENEQFVSRFHEKYPQRSITDPMESAYVGVMLWARAANDARSLEPKKIRRAMLEQRFSSPGGEVRIDPDTQHSYKTPRIGQIQADGHFRIVWEAPDSVTPEPYPSSRTAADWQVFLHDLYTGWGNRWSAP